MSISQIADLPAPVAAAKADWLVATTWIGFTPASDAPDATSRCAATISRQFGTGYIIEYITRNFGKPNPGFEADPAYLENKKAHGASAGRLVAIHRLRPSARPLKTIMGDADYERMQDMWSENPGRKRWSVAFPIIESYEITTKPQANSVLSPAAMQRLFAHPSATLRPLNDDERAMLADLPLQSRESANAWIAIEDEIARAEGSELPGSLVRDIRRDLASALEGMPEERKAKVRRRAAWVAYQFVRGRQRDGTLHCDRCKFDPAECLKELPVKPRSVLDAHHLNPLAEGQRRTWVGDFALLCPTCHRIEHLMQAKTGT